jgi:cobalt-precorrin 5A hydrolase / precorrin-3B C17-methyltransferase
MRDVVLGIGCERGASANEVWYLVEQSLTTARVAKSDIACIASIVLKADEPAIQNAARKLGVSIRYFDARRLEQETPRLKTPSEVVYRETGCHGVAEGAALAAAGPDSDLILPKQRSARATCALARKREE